MGRATGWTAPSRFALPVIFMGRNTSFLRLILWMKDETAMAKTILLNAKNVRWRRNFDLAHELFHLLTWKTFRTTAEREAVEASEAEEKFATCFARNLLAPPEILRVAVDEALARHDGKLRFDDFFEIARQFDVSVEVIVRHIGFVYRKPADWANTVLDQLQSQIGFWDNRVSDTPRALPLRFHALARQALRHGLLSTGTCIEIAPFYQASEGNGAFNPPPALGGRAAPSRCRSAAGRSPHPARTTSAGGRRRWS